MLKKRFSSIFIILILSACIDRISLISDDEVPSQLVVDGFISDSPGPYEIKIFKSSRVAEDLTRRVPLTVKSVSISDDEGNVVSLAQSIDGIYSTDPKELQGHVGGIYKLRIETLDGVIYESSPEKMFPVNDIDSVYYQFDSNLPLNGPTQYGFRVFMNTHNENLDNPYLRWRFTGNYMVQAFPMKQTPDGCGIQQFHASFGPAPPNPPICSGYIWTGEVLKRVGECTCCFCWISDFEGKPRLNSDLVNTSGSYKKIELGYVPFDHWRFWFKYMVRVEQMSLSKDAYEFFKVIKDQKEGISSLFQPSLGKMRTNIFSTNSKNEATGIFYATSIKKKITYLSVDDAPLPPKPFDTEPEYNCVLFHACDRAFDNATTVPPLDWQ